MEGRPNPCLPAEFAFRFRQQERGHGVLHQIGHDRVLGCHIKEWNPSAVVQGAIAEGHAVPNRQSWHLTNRERRLFQRRVVDCPELGAQLVSLAPKYSTEDVNGDWHHHDFDRE